MCKYKMDTGSDGNLIPINVQNVVSAYKHKETKQIYLKKITIITSWIPQRGISRVAVINKGIKYQWNFFVVPGNGPTLLGIPDCKMPAAPGHTARQQNDPCKRMQINE